MWSLLSNNPFSCSLSAFSFKRCLFVWKNNVHNAGPLHKIRPNMPFNIFKAAALPPNPPQPPPHKIYSINENAPTNKTIMSRILPLESIMVEGALCSKEKEKCVWGDFRLFVFKAPSQPSPFPSVHSSFYTYRLAYIQTRTHTWHIWSLGIYTSARRPIQLVNTIVLKRLYNIGRCSELEH